MDLEQKLNLLTLAKWGVPIIFALLIGIIEYRIYVYEKQLTAQKEAETSRRQSDDKKDIIDAITSVTHIAPSFGVSTADIEYSEQQDTVLYTFPINNRTVGIAYPVNFEYFFIVRKSLLQYELRRYKRLTDIRVGSNEYLRVKGRIVNANFSTKTDDIVMFIRGNYTDIVTKKRTDFKMFFIRHRGDNIWSFENPPNALEDALNTGNPDQWDEIYRD